MALLFVGLAVVAAAVWIVGSRRQSIPATALGATVCTVCIIAAIVTAFHGRTNIDSNASAASTFDEPYHGQLILGHTYATRPKASNVPCAGIASDVPKLEGLTLAEEEPILARDGGTLIRLNDTFMLSGLETENGGLAHIVPSSTGRPCWVPQSDLVQMIASDIEGQASPAPADSPSPEIAPGSVARPQRIDTNAAAPEPSAAPTGWWAGTPQP